MVKVHFILGLIGGILGLLMTPLYLLLALAILVVAALAQAPQVGLLLLVLMIVAPVAALLGIIGAILSRKRLSLGGVVMLTSGALPLVLGAVSLAVIARTAANLPSGLIPLYTLFFWNFILIAAGTLSILKSRSPRPLPQANQLNSPANPA